MKALDEAQLEIAVCDWLKAEPLGWEYVHGPTIAPDGEAPERADYGQVVLVERLRNALERINPTIPAEAIEEAMRQVLRPESPSLIENNRRFHKMLTDGVDVSWRTDLSADEAGDGEKHDKVWLVDRDDPDNNEFLVVNQFTVIEDLSAGQAGKRNRRPDVVLFVNGLPLVVIELKNPAEEKTTLRHAYNQLQTYKKDIPSLFTYNALLVISDGFSARAGTLTSGWDRFMPWRTIDGTEVVQKGQIETEVLLRGLFDRQRFLDYVLNFITFEDDGKTIIKKAAAYHQYWAVNKAVSCTIEATRPEGDRRIGVVWHTQGSGKSLSMVFYAGKVIRHPAMENPTVVVITDRNDLDDQLFGTFAGNSDLLRQKPVQASSRAHLKECLRVASGGVIFTTIQKFEEADDGEPLSERHNIVVIADEAHRSQYGFKAKIDRKSGDIKYGFAQYLRDALPNASFIGFTGTPVELDDKNTPAVFGNYIDKYDILRAVEDGATVPIYYESRLAKLELNEEETPHIDEEFEEITEDQEETTKEKLKTKWAALEAMVGTDKRLGLVAEDLVQHFERRLEAMDGKAMIVCMSRRICVALYDAIVKLRPDWHADDDAKGVIKVVMSGSAGDDPTWQGHIRSKTAREELAKRFKDPADPLKLVIVRDMWLTGFDCPSMHTMYIDKPMGGHNLMQAIARVNRVFKDKPGGLVVDYLGIADALKRALKTYTASGGKGEATVDQDQAVAVMLEKYAVVKDMMHGFDLPAPFPTGFCVYAIECDNGSIYIGQTEDLSKRWKQHVAGTASRHTKLFRPIRIVCSEQVASRDEAVRKEREWKTGAGRRRIKQFMLNKRGRQAGYPAILRMSAGERMKAIAEAMEYVLGLDDGKRRFLQAVSALSKAFALAVPHEKALAIRDEVGLFQEIRSGLVKATVSETERSPAELDSAVRQLVSKAVAPTEVVDIFAAAGLDKPDISILSDEFLAEVKRLPQRNLALELLRKLINDDIKVRMRRNVVQARAFSEMLKQAIRKYQNRAIEAAEVIEELIQLAREMRDAQKRGENLGLTDDEIAFYDALEANDSAVQVLGDEKLKLIAQELVDAVKRSVTVDWTKRENARAQIRVIVKRILRKHGYPPDKQAKATEQVLEQAAALCTNWANEVFS
ncbi:MAG: hypothetical protein KatS3mg105_5244 [Gemmatales bacterium]|nr:MAG: hypothetical protein KatS3mg105_5244 [Gemmatales bacterium]GIW97200.1 MAG: hypothetical protein KatS3mg111_0533 [Pirellulaceae bacterium]